MSVLSQSRRLVEVAPHRGAHRAAVRAGIAVALPLLALAAVGHLELSLYALFGAFTSLYGRTHTHGSRLRMQASAGAALVAAVVIGTAIGTLPLAEAVVVPVAALVAGGATFLSDALEWHPPGALFFVFALAACAAVPADPARVPVAFALAAGSALLAMAISGAGAVLPAARGRRRAAVSARGAAPGPGPASASATAPAPASGSVPAGSASAVGSASGPAGPASALGSGAATSSEVGAFAGDARRAGGLGTVVAVTIAVGVAGAIPTVSGLGHPYWAMVAAAATFAGADAAARFVRAGHRLFGTLLGIALAAVLLALPLTASPLLAIVVVVLLQVGAELFVGRNYGIAMVFVTPLALLMTELAHPTPAGALLLDRTVETVLGVAVGTAVLTTALLARRTHPARRPRPRNDGVSRRTTETTEAQTALTE